MAYLCPICRSPLGADNVCGQGHHTDYEGGILRLITPDFARQLERYLPALQTFRSSIGRRILDAGAYAQLPYGPAARGDREWAQRQYDLGVVLVAIRRRWPTGAGRTVLDIGAYNGWLSGQLARRGHAVTGIDPFTDPYDGLGAHRHYGAAWAPVQLDLRDLSLLNTSYDLVVLNRCLAFSPEPVEALRQAQARVAPGGLLVALGVQVFYDSQVKARQVAERSASFEARYGPPFFLWPTRGFLDGQDAAALRGAGLHLRRYWQLWWPDLKAQLRPVLPRHYWGLWSAP